MDSLKTTLQDSLDEVTSPRSSDERRAHGLAALERAVARACLAEDNGAAEDLQALQYTFECNVPCRLLGWIVQSTSRLETLASRGSDDTPEMAVLSGQLAASLSLIQGITLNHPSTKAFLGRQYALEVLLDLLLASRHSPARPTPSEPGPSQARTPPLTSVVIDTLLCILVDSSTALRVFEDAHGLQAIVKILKRAGTPREVRMKCLEFLYFYLLDETPLPSSQPPEEQPISEAGASQTAPGTPVREGESHIPMPPSYPVSSYGSSTFSFPSTSTSESGTTSRSVSSSSASSFSSTSSNASSSTAASTAPSLSSSPEKTFIHCEKSSSSPDQSFAFPAPGTSPTTRPDGHARHRSLMMLRKEVDFVPISPKKAQVAELGVRASSGLNLRTGAQPGSGMRTSTPRHVRAKSSISRTPSRLMSEMSSDYEGSGLSPQKRVIENGFPKIQRDGSLRSIEEKKELLGTMLGNVDALVEGVKKAGVWGLG